MSIEVTNPKSRSERLYSASELEVGVLYKSALGDYETVFIKTLQGFVVWFENGRERIGSYSGANRSYVRAPEGTKVILTQPESTWKSTT